MSIMREHASLITNMEGDRGNCGCGKYLYYSSRQKGWYLTFYKGDTMKLYINLECGDLHLL